MNASPRARTEAMGTRRAVRQASTAASNWSPLAEGWPARARSSAAPFALARGIGGRRGRARRGQHAALVGNRFPFPEDLHHQVPHDLEAQREVGDVRAAQTAHAAPCRGQAADGASDVHRRPVGLDRLAVRRLRPHAARLAHVGRRVGVGRRQRLVGEPRIRDEAAGARGAHHVAAPQRVDAQDGVARQFFESLAHCFAASLPFLTEPNHRYRQNPMNPTAETIWEMASFPKKGVLIQLSA